MTFEIPVYSGVLTILSVLSYLKWKVQLQVWFRSLYSPQRLRKLFKNSLFAKDFFENPQK
jgi:hypothetical protein